jgi:aspartate aminotransferase
LPETNSKRLRDDFTKVAATVYTNVSTPTQYAAVTAFEPNEEIEDYFVVTREIHRIMGTNVSRGFDGVDGVRATAPQGTFYFFADFNGLAPDLKRKGVATSNDLAYSLISHPHHIVAVTGDACLLEPGDYGARVAFVDYDGGEAIESFKRKPPRGDAEELAFAKENAPRMFEGIEALKGYVDFILTA